VGFILAPLRGLQRISTMTRRRWIADEVDGNYAALIGEHADHLVRVLRARVGQEFDVAAGEVLRRGRVVKIGENRVEFELGEELQPAEILDLTLLLSIFKFDRMEWAIEKCVELGVSRIIPVVARRSDAHLVAAAGKRVERWRRIALQAAEQSRQTTPPEIADPIKLSEVVKLPGALRIVLAESEERTQLRDALASSPVLHARCARRADEGVRPYIAEKEGMVLLAVGPEGGWGDDELQFFAQAGWISASLGATILRAETAAIAAVAVSALS
jgi:16S rRNA (uracil1498-N3)-methyltransferase